MEGALVKPIETQIRILDSAERLFAASGFEGTSLRTITADAKVNLAAVNYHFGSKEALLEAVLRRRIAPVNEERLSRLDALEAKSGGRSLNARHVLRAFIEPPFLKMGEWGEAGQKFMQIIGRTYADTSPKIQDMFLRQFGTVIERFTAAFQNALPDLAPEVVNRRLHFVIGGMAHTLAWSNKLCDRSDEGEAAEVLLEDLIRFAAAGLKTPVPVLEKEGTS